ncbi:hypothetical protein GH5_07214 [Leishmania sp. Ghana 2012 LV757]|uniref:hypothetical protein n=1 Tax=Leishmania sp. Ghana 2012 LV757 TaxID=2803181 RepID=UPI001B662212|nr:hypothetical protein GH5_07214 [Leishmania sp. Ghana 2012 LV757]
MINDAAHPRVVRTRLPPLRVQTQLYTGIVAFVLCLLLIFVGIFSPLVVLRNLDKRYERAIRPFEYNLANAAVTPFRLAMVEAYGISQALEGYVLSRLEKLPDLAAPPMERIRGQNFPNFDLIGTALLHNLSMIPMAALLPGGVYAFISPAKAATYGRDTLDPHDNAQNYEPTPMETILLGNAVYVGPFRSSSEILLGHWGLAVRRPIFNRTTYLVSDISTFWGFAVTLVNISGILDTNPFDFTELMRGKYGDVDYLLSVEEKSSGNITVIATSLKQPTQTQLAEFIRLGTSIDVAPNHPFAVTIRGRRYGANLSPANVLAVVSTVLAGLLVAFAAVIAAMLWCTRVYDGTVHAPKMAPFAMLTIGPCRGEELWDLAAKQMAEMTEQLDQVLARQMERHGAYQIQQVHPLTTSYVTRSVAAAVQMAFSTIEELQRHPIDGPLRAVLGNGGPLRLAYAVHWCTDAAVRVESLEGTYRYEGPDVVFGGRMWAFAAPSVVTASEAVAQALPRFGLRSVDARPYRVVNVMRSRTICGATCGKELSSSGATTATIYVPYPLPSTVKAAAGVRCCSDASPTAALMDSNSDIEEAEPLPPQQLFTLLDRRRPALVAAAAAAPTDSDVFLSTSEANNSVGAAVNLSDGDEVWSPPSPLSVVDGNTANSGDVGAITRTGPISCVQPDNDGNELLSVQSSPVVQQLPNASNSLDIVSNGTTAAVPWNYLSFQGDAVTRALLQPLIPRALDVALRIAFDYQSITLNVRYDEVRVLVYYFYSSYKILFRPLAAPERLNIFRRLVTAFGVPQQGILEHLAARCSIRYVQNRSKSRQFTLQRRRSRACTGAAPLSLTAQERPGKKHVDEPLPAARSEESGAQAHVPR